MSARRTIFGLVAALLVSTAPRAAHAEAAAGLRIPFEFRSWTLRDAAGEETTLEQTYGGLISTVRFSPAASVVVSTAGALSRREVGAARDELDGLSDLRGELYLRVFGDRGLVLLGATAPTGTTGLTPEELRTADALGNPLLGTRLREYGRGPGVNAGLAWSLPMGRGMQLGLGAGALLPGTFTLIEGTGDFRPTPELSASVGIDLNGTTEREEARALSVRGTWRTYFEDKLDGIAVFEEGDQLELGASGTADFGRMRATLGADGVFKRDNTTLVEDGSAVEAVKNRAGTGLLAHGSVTARVSRALRLGVEGEWRRFEKSEVAEYNGDTFAAGPVLQLVPSSSFLMKLGVMFQDGTAGDAPDELDLGGYSVASTIVWRPFR